MNNQFECEEREGQTGYKWKMVLAVDFKRKKRDIHTDCESNVGKNVVSGGYECRGKKRTYQLGVENGVSNGYKWRKGIYARAGR